MRMVKEITFLIFSGTYVLVGVLILFAAGIIIFHWYNEWKRNQRKKSCYYEGRKKDEDKPDRYRPDQKI